MGHGGQRKGRAVGRGLVELLRQVAAVVADDRAGHGVEQDPLRLGEPGAAQEEGAAGLLPPRPPRPVVEERATRYREDVTRDPGSSYLYLRDARSGAVWSATHQRSATAGAGAGAGLRASSSERRRATAACRGARS